MTERILLTVHDHERLILTFKENGELVFDDADEDTAIVVFWEGMLKSAPILAPETATINIGSPHDAPIRTAITLHRSGGISSENYVPDARAYRFWLRLAQSWPRPVVNVTAAPRPATATATATTIQAPLFGGKPGIDTARN